MRFSQRIGKVKTVKEIQLESIDDDLKNRLWNLVKILFLDNLEKYSQYETPEFRIFADSLWHNYYKLPVDTIPEYNSSIEAYIRKRFYSGVWYEIYDFIEFILRTRFNKENKKEFVKALNEVLESEFSGYRIIDYKVAPISNELEFNEIITSIEKTGSFTALKGANIHLGNALNLFSEKKNPDHRNSIKESISAVEATCRILTGESTLGKALNKLEEKGLNINPQIKSGFDKIYAYTNDKQNGIRHAIVEQPIEPDYNDAKYMLVSCSLFINYLIGKAETIGIQIE